jgi:formylglycine-generating enzyme required for sulfatase activity
MQFDNLMVWSSDTAPAPPELAPTRKTNAADMVLIRGGAFIMGSNIGDTTQPPHIVELSDFYIDRTEVTNFDYLHCVDVGGCTPINPPDSATHKNYATDFAFANFPALNMPWQQARDFCTWAEKRLPTEAEWEKAATWNSATRTKSIWPWGNRFDPERANTAESGSGDTTKVGQFFEEQNHTYDMAGNVAEWTSSLDKPYPYVADDGREDPAGSGARVIRGGSWDDPQEQTRGSVRQAVDPTSFSTKLGFRCAANP